MTQTAIEIRKLLQAMPKTDRGFSWELRDYRGNERLECYNSLARAFKYILDNTDEVIAALANTQGGVKVKELEFDDTHAERGYWRAATQFGYYRIKRYDEKQFILRGPLSNDLIYPSFEAAKAAAQADFSTRIRSAITLQGEPVGYMRKSAIKALKDTDTESFEGVHTMVSRYPNKYNTEPLYTAPTLAHQPVTAGLELSDIAIEAAVEAFHKARENAGIPVSLRAAIRAALKSGGRKDG